MTSEGDNDRVIGGGSVWKEWLQSNQDNQTYQLSIWKMFIFSKQTSKH